MDEQGAWVMVGNEAAFRAAEALFVFLFSSARWIMSFLSYYAEWFNIKPKIPEVAKVVYRDTLDWSRRPHASPKLSDKRASCQEQRRQDIPSVLPITYHELDSLGNKEMV